MKVRQPRLLPKTVLEPIGDGDALTLEALTTRYECRCGNPVETGMKLEAFVCVKCGAAIVPSS